MAAYGCAKQNLTPNVRHERRHKVGEARFGTSARWRGWASPRQKRVVASLVCNDQVSDLPCLIPFLHKYQAKRGALSLADEFHRAVGEVFVTVPSAPLLP